MTPDYLQVRVFSVIEKSGIQTSDTKLEHSATLTPDKIARMLSDAPLSRRLLFAIGPAIKLFVPLNENTGANKWVQLDELI